MNSRKRLKITPNKSIRLYKYNKSNENKNSNNIEAFESSIEEMEELIKSLEEIKNEYYSTNAKLEEIQKTKASDIIRSVFHRFNISNKQDIK